MEPPRLGRKEENQIKVISAMFCGCPARGEQNGIKLNVIHSAII